MYIDDNEWETCSHTRLKILYKNRLEEIEYLINSLEELNELFLEKQWDRFRMTRKLKDEEKEKLLGIYFNFGNRPNYIYENKF